MGWNGMGWEEEEAGRERQAGAKFAGGVQGPVCFDFDLAAPPMLA